MINEVCSLYNKNISIVNIGKLLALPRRQVRSILVSEGIKIRGGAVRKYEVNENYFDVIDTEQKAYFLGFLYADGYNNTKTNCVRICLHEKDIDVLEKLNRLIHKDKPISKYSNRSNGTNYPILDMFSKKISQSLVKLGCDKNKTFNIKFPTEEQVPKHLYNHFIRGYFDGDGCITSYVHKRKITPDNTFSIVGTESFLTSVIYIIKCELNIQVNKLYTRHPERNHCIRSFFISGNTNCKKIREWLYKDSTIYLNRKKDKFDLI